MKTLKYLTLLSVVVGAGLLAGTPVAYAHHGGEEREYNVLHHGGASLGDYHGDDSGQFTVKGTNKHSVLKSNDPMHYRVCHHHGSGTMTVIHDGQTTPLHEGNCSDFQASDIDVEGTDAEGSASGDFGPVETRSHHMSHHHHHHH